MAYKSRITTRGLFEAKDTSPYKISRSKLDLFSDCRRCAYLDMRLGVKRPSMPAFTLNNAVDELLKREFDIHRANGTVHPLLNSYGVKAIPFNDERMDEWRDALRRGISYFHEPTNIILRGGVDDVWINDDKEIIIVDYKATSKKIGPSSGEDLYPSYKKQMEIYQWLFRKNGFKVSPIGYFVYVNGKSDAKAFDAKLEFDLKLIPYEGNDSWIEEMLFDLKKTLLSDQIPEVGISFGGGPCEYCSYREDAGKILMSIHSKNKNGKKESI